MQSNNQLNTFVANIITVYARLYNGLDSLVKTHVIPSVGPFAETKGRNIVQKEIKEYLSNLKQVTTKDDLEITIQSMQKYVTRLTKINMEMFLLRNEA